MAKPRSSLKLIGLVIFVLVILGVIAYSQNQKNQEAAQQTAQAAKSYIFANDESVQKDSLGADKVNVGRLRTRVQARQTVALDTSQLDAQINAVISQNPDIQFGVSIKDIATGTFYNYGNSGPMTAASVTKVLTAVYYLKEVELGHKSLSTIMSNGYSAQYNMEQMIVVSDNNAWHILNDALGYPQMQEYAHSIGLESYDYTENKISSNDTAQLFADLYERKLINETNTELLLSYMERANYRDLIIPAVPSTDTVYHKAGEYIASLNDAAIITNTENAIVLSIYTESTGTYSKSRVASLMQQITTPTLTTFQLN